VYNEAGEEIEYHEGFVSIEEAQKELHEAIE